jgi:hypothetical protein
VDIETEAAQFPEKEYINGIFVAVQLFDWSEQALAGIFVSKSRHIQTEKVWVS